MFQHRSFLVTLALTAALGTTGPAAIATGPARELAASQGTVAVDQCHVTARMVQMGDKVFALFSATNHGDEPETVEFHYSAFRTPETSMVSRMLPFPQQVAQGKCTLSIGADETVSHTVLLREGEPQFFSQDPKEPLGFGMTGAMWRLLVARSAIDEAAGWGAVPPSVGDGVPSLGAAHIVLAATQLGFPVSG